MADPLQVIADAKTKHHINVEATPENIELVLYALHVGYGEGWSDHKEQIAS